MVVVRREEVTNRGTEFVWISYGSHDFFDGLGVGSEIPV
jgi:hypothetical protein